MILLMQSTLSSGSIRAADATHVLPGAQRTAIAAWTIVLATSLAPTVIAQEVLGQAFSADLRAASSVAVLVIGLALGLRSATLRRLRPLLLVLLVLIGARWFVFERLDRLPAFASWLADPSFGVYMPAELALSLVVTLAMIAMLLVLERGRRRFYLALGEPSAPAAPIRWMGVGPGARWSRLGPILAVAITLGTVTFLAASGTPSFEGLTAAIPLLPAVLFCAALNALNEEVTYKASLLSVLAGAVGPRHALRMTAGYFGIAHFYGVPYGLVGVVMAWFLGWILARSMLETRGIWWAWFVHFLQDVAIFGFMAVGAIQAGGG